MFSSFNLPHPIMIDQGESTKASWFTHSIQIQFHDRQSIEQQSDACGEENQTHNHKILEQIIIDDPRPIPHNIPLVVGKNETDWADDLYDESNQHGEFYDATFGALAVRETQQEDT